MTTITLNPSLNGSNEGVIAPATPQSNNVVAPITALPQFITATSGTNWPLSLLSSPSIRTLQAAGSGGSMILQPQLTAVQGGLSPAQLINPTTQLISLAAAANGGAAGTTAVLPQIISPFPIQVPVSMPSLPVVTIQLPQTHNIS